MKVKNHCGEGSFWDIIPWGSSRIILLFIIIPAVNILYVTDWGTGESNRIRGNAGRNQHP
ncbi:MULTISPECIES: hypothetical protein [Robinsoniella]|uniref:hypothetical protein n=1 Tax=Robinsoniella TaxID=588605 RepID=UPI0005C7CFD6|nr:hypothetical protein [Robinsoniella peoriensis]